MKWRQLRQVTQKIFLAVMFPNTKMLTFDRKSSIVNLFGSSYLVSLVFILQHRALIVSILHLGVI